MQAEWLAEWLHAFKSGLVIVLVGVLMVVTLWTTAVILW